MPLERVQKILAAAGYGSRRACEQIVADGRVRVNGRIETALPLMVDVETDRIAVDGKPVRKARTVFFLMNKPPGIAASVTPQEGRKTLTTLLSRVREPVTAVGRTEPECGGLLLLTNDRDTAERLASPRGGLAKTYRVEVQGRIESDGLAQLRGGIRLSEGRTAPAEVRVVHADRERTIIEMKMNDSLQREIPRAVAKIGHKVRRMVRIQMGRLSIRKLPVGAVRPLTPVEIEYLKSAAGDEARSATPAGFGGRYGSVGQNRSSARGSPRTRREGAPPAPDRSEKKRGRPEKSRVEKPRQLKPAPRDVPPKKRRIIMPES